MAWLDDHPPVRDQFRCPRREEPSGVVVVHTAESAPDLAPPDTGAENVANFIRNRDDAGSYHDLADSDTDINLVRYDCEAYHDGTGSNPHSYGVSAATYAHAWADVPLDWKIACVNRMAACAARYAQWLATRRGIIIPARRITRDESELRIPGFISHAERDPGRRSDPGSGFPWDAFLAEYARLTTSQGDWLDMVSEAELDAKLSALEANIIKHITGTLPVIVAFDDVNPGEPDHWYSVPAQTRSEVTQDGANQAVNQGTARWWDSANPGVPVRVPRPTLEATPLVVSDEPPDA